MIMFVFGNLTGVGCNDQNVHVAWSFRPSKIFGNRCTFVSLLNLDDCWEVSP